MAWIEACPQGQEMRKKAPERRLHAPRRAKRQAAPVVFKNFADVDAICPFYVGMDASGRLLRCEALFEHSTLTTAFRSPKWCMEHVRRYCQSFQCEKCPLYRALDAKYDAAGAPFAARKYGAFLAPECRKRRGFTERL